MAGRRRRRHFIRSGFIAVLGLGFAGAVYGELVRPRLEWLHPPGMISLVSVSPAPLGNVALARFLEAGPETARASGVPGRLLLAEPAFFSMELVSGTASDEAPIPESIVGGNSEYGPARVGAGSVRGLSGGISKLGRIARALAAAQSRHHSKHTALSSSAGATKPTAGPDQRDNRGNEGNQDQDDADDANHAGSNPLEVTVTPEPATLWLVSGGMLGLMIAGLLRRSRKMS